jgi:hypothetical protein
VGALCGCCTWCPLLLTGWCKGFCGVRVSEALAAYVVLVPFLLVGLGKCLHNTKFQSDVYRFCLVVCLLVSYPGIGMDWQRHLLLDYYE